jgi:hypothetical protein
MLTQVGGSCTLNKQYIKILTIETSLSFITDVAEA